jgi:multiple sugar transport system substrate-binding protein
MCRTIDEAGNLPDLIMIPQGDRLLYPKLAWENKLVDVTDLIAPIEDDYPPHVLRAITYRNSAQARPSYYTVPLGQVAVFIFYWQDLLATAGLNAADIPQDWDGFWQFWQQAQSQLNQQNLDLYALGLPVSGNNVDRSAYSQVLAENIWGKALTKVTRDRRPPEQAADEAIARIREIFSEWGK